MLGKSAAARSEIPPEKRGLIKARLKLPRELTGNTRLDVSGFNRPEWLN
jgi:hypothetical protein